MTYSKWIRCAVAAGLLTGWTAACDFIDPTSSNPNAVPDASIDQLFVSGQVNAWFFNEGQLSRLVSVWTRQMAGTDRQFADLELYLGLGESTATDEFYRPYGSGNTRTGGGLLDLRRAQGLAEEDGRLVYKGILQVHEAFLIGMAASIWGDIPYSQAANPEFTEPVLDDQADVYAAVQLLLDDAIDNLQSGTGAGPGENDFVFAGDATAWAAVAYTLKARLYLHWVEVDGNTRYTDALNAAQNGIQTAAGNWVSVHTATIPESNLWNQFQNDRSGYISSNAYLVEMLDVDQDRAYNPAVDDDRLPVYFTTGTAGFAGQYIGSPTGSPAGDPGTSASNLAVPGEADYGQPILTCWENHLIVAEAEAVVGTEANARTALQAALDCQEDYWGGLGYTIDLGTVDAGLTGQALFDEIMAQKYMAMFLNIEVWNDHKRTCTPTIPPPPGETEVVARLFYPNAERETNSNVPSPGVDPNDERNDNDPAACPP
jgi:hypothetical protein